MNHWDYTVIGLYLLGMLVLSIKVAGHNHTTTDYFFAGRRLPYWVIGLSLVGTSISSITFLAYPADAFKTNWIRFLPNLILPIAALLAVRWFIPLFRKGEFSTCYQYLGHRFGTTTQRYAATVFLLGQVLRVSVILYLLALLIQTFTDLPIAACIIGAGLFVTAYTLIGGIEAVIWTDVIQSLVLVVGGIVCLVVIGMHLPDWSSAWSAAWQADKLSVGAQVNGAFVAPDWTFTLSEKTITMMLCLGLIHWLTEFCGNQNTVQRFIAARSERAAKQSLWVCVASSLPIWALFMAVGTALWLFFQQIPHEQASAMLNGEQPAEGILPLFVMETLPAGIRGLILAAALAAAMSSLDSSLNAISTVVLIDGWRGDQIWSDATQLKRARQLTAAAGICMIMGALLFHSMTTSTVQDTLTKGVSILAGGLLALYLLAAFSSIRRESPILIAIGATLFTGGLIAFEALPWAVDPYNLALVSNLTLLVVALITHRFIGEVPAETQPLASQKASKEQPMEQPMEQPIRTTESIH